MQMHNIETKPTRRRSPHGMWVLAIWAWIGIGLVLATDWGVRRLAFSGPGLSCSQWVQIGQSRSTLCLDATLKKQCPHVQGGDRVWLQAGACKIESQGMSNPMRSSLGIDLNLCTMQQEDWESLPNIGPVLATRIVRFLEHRSCPQRIESLGEVKGIGPQTLARLRPMFHESKR